MSLKLLGELFIELDSSLDIATTDMADMLVDTIDLSPETCSSDSNIQFSKSSSASKLSFSSTENVTEKEDDLMTTDINSYESVESVFKELEDFELLSYSQSPPRDSKVSTLKYPPCAVCSGKSSGLHYGCYTCEACKNFFRRYLLRNYGFMCKKKDSCVISDRSRGNCSGCRLKKCLAIGMSKDKSKIGRYTHAQRTKTITEVNRLEGKHNDCEIDELEGIAGAEEVENEIDSLNIEVNHDFEEVTKNHLSGLKPSDQAIVNILMEALDNIKHFGERGSTLAGIDDIISEHYDKYLAKIKLFGPLKAIPKNEYYILLKMYNIDLDGRWTLFKKEANNCAHIVEKYCQFALKIPGFQQFTLKDKEVLLKVGHCDFFVILMHEGYCEKRKIVLEMNGVPSHVEEAADKIFSRPLIELQCDIFLKWQKMKLTKEEKTLLCAMSLVCADRVELENASLVDQCHAHLTEILSTIMKYQFGGEAQRRFAKFIDILTFTRHASELYYKEYQEMCQNEMVTQVAPAFPTLCPDHF